MKKLAFSLIACLAFVQSTYAVTSPLSESLLEYETITSAIGTNPNFQDIIGPSEFIVDIKRITDHVDFIGIVKYRIKTRSKVEEEDLHHTHTYIAKVEVSLNPGIGPNIVTVLSIKKVHSKAISLFN